MVRSKDMLILVGQKLADSTILFCVWNIIVWCRFKFIAGAQPGLELEYLKAGLLLVAITLFFFAKEGVYKSYRLKSSFEEVQKVIHSHSVAVVAFVIVLYFMNSNRLSRGVILAHYLFGAVALVGFRYCVRLALRHLRRNGRNLRHTVLIGTSVTLRRYVENVMSFPDSGVRFVGWFDSSGDAESFRIPDISEEVLTEKLKSGVDGIVIGYEGSAIFKVDQNLQKFHDGLVPVVVIPDTKHFFVGYKVDTLAGVSALSVNEPNYSTINVVSKRLFDLCASAGGLILISPLLGVLALLVRISSAGPIFFAQERVGLDGRHFKMWKFRSMKMANGSGDGSNIPGWTVKNDPRKTKIGSFLRATSLDELPQLWNVFMGDMSLVGPRPEQPYYVEKFRYEIPAYMLRHKVKSGITGWAQVNGWRGDTSLHERIQCDLFYIRNWSLWFDIKIIFLTFWKGFINKNAY